MPQHAGSRLASAVEACVQADPHAEAPPLITIEKTYRLECDWTFAGRKCHATFTVRDEHTVLAAIAKARKNGWTVSGHHQSGHSVRCPDHVWMFIVR